MRGSWVSLVACVGGLPMLAACAAHRAAVAPEPPAFRGTPVDDAALADHPELRARTLRAEADEERASSESGLPPPTISTEIWQVPWAVPYRLDKASTAWITLAQDIPASALLDLTKETNEAGADMERAERSAASIRIVTEARGAWLDVVRFTRMHAVHVEHRDVVEKIRAIAAQRVATGGGLDEVAVADAAVAELDAQIARSVADLDAARARLNGLLRRPPDADIDVPTSPKVETVGAPLEAVLAQAHGSSGPLRVARATAERAEKVAHASRLAVTVPDFGVAWETFLPLNNQPFGWGAMVRMSVPWVWNGARGGARADAIEARAAKADVDAEAVRVDTSVRTVYERVRGAERRVRVIASTVQPAADHALEIATADYGAGSVPLDRWFRASEGVLQTKDMRIDAEGDLASALNDLDMAVGSPVPRAALDDIEVKR